MDLRCLHLQVVTFGRSRPIRSVPWKRIRTTDSVDALTVPSCLARNGWIFAHPRMVPGGRRGRRHALG